jgi:trans-aconitate methyltransferase
MTAQVWNPEQYREHAAFVPALGQKLVALLAGRAGERVLDLGCGDGALTIQLVKTGCDVIGVDASAEQVAAACALGVDARVMSGEALTFESRFDAVFSNAALHWMKDAAQVANGVSRALVPGGRFVAEMGGAGNVAIIREALEQALDRRGFCGSAHSPWYFPTPAAHRAVLENAGFVIDAIESFARPTALPGDVLAWLQTMAQAYADPLAPEERATYYAEVREQLVPKLQNADGSFWADYVRLRFVAHKPAAT